MYNDTSGLNEADRKARDFGAVAYSEFYAGKRLFSRHYYTPDGIECGYYLPDLNSFTAIRREVHPSMRGPLIRLANG